MFLGVVIRFLLLIFYLQFIKAAEMLFFMYLDEYDVFEM